MQRIIVTTIITKVFQPGATLTMTAVQTTFASTRTPPRVICVPPPTPASASLHPTATTRMATHSTMQLACAVGRVGALPIPVCIVPAHHLSAVPFCHALKPVAVYLTRKNARVSRKIAHPKTVSSATPHQNHVQKEIVVLML